MMKLPKFAVAVAGVAGLLMPVASALRAGPSSVTVHHSQWRALSGGTLLAQDPDLGRAELPVSKVFGQATLADGAPWAGAIVHFVARPDNSSEQSGELHRVQVTADDAGKFRAEVRTGWSYCCWAIEDLNETEFRVSVAKADVRARERVELTAAAAPAERRVLKFRGLDAWRDSGPFAVRLVQPFAACATYPLDLAEDDSVRIPSLPTVATYLELDTAAGLPLLRPDFNCRSFDNGATIEVAPPSPQWIAVRDSGGKKPMEGADIVLVRRGRTIKLGETGADGMAQVDAGFMSSHLDERSPRKPKWGNVAYVRLDGHELGYLQRAEVPPAADRSLAELREAGEAHAWVNLRPSGKAWGRITAGALPLPGVSILVETTAWSQDGENRATGTSVKFRVRTDAEGRFEILGLENDDEFRFRVSLDRPAVLALPQAWRRDLLPTVDLSGAAMGSKKGMDLGEIDLLAMRPLELFLTGPDGAPAEDAQVVITESLGSDGSSELTRRADRLGRIKFLLPTEGERLLGVFHSMGWKFGRLAGRALKATDGPTRLPMVLQPNARLRGKLQVAGGAPDIDYSGFVLRASRQFSSRGRGLGRLFGGGKNLGKASDAVPELVSPVTDPSQNERIAGALLLRGSASFDGSFDLPVPAVPGLVFNVSASGRVDGQRRSSPRQAVTIHEESDYVLELQLR